MASKHRTEYTALLVSRETQIKTAVRYHLPPLEELKVKNVVTPNVGDHVKQWEWL